MPRIMQPRLPLDPLLEVVRAQTHREAARRLGIPEKRFYVYKNLGVPCLAADDLATHLGTHPALLWGPAWQEASDRYTLSRSQSRVARRARKRAVEALIEAHPDEFARLLRGELMASVA